MIRVFILFFLSICMTSNADQSEMYCLDRSLNFCVSYSADMKMATNHLEGKATGPREMTGKQRRIAKRFVKLTKDLQRQPRRDPLVAQIKACSKPIYVLRGETKLVVCFDGESEKAKKIRGLAFKL